jgi:uncharacterized protein
MLDINGNSIAPGQNEVVKLPVGRLHSGTPISVQVHVFRSLEPGPVMMLLAGVHGDEINGVEIVRRTLSSDFFERLKCGSVIVIPLLNIYGFIQFSRDVPDGKDINRSFPGNMAGSLASRVARTLTRKVLPHIDFGIDLHTGGRNLYNYPQIRFTKGDVKGEELARAFGAPFLIAKPPIAKSLRKVAQADGKSVIVFEGGESLRYDGLSIHKALAGLKRLMHSQGMIDEQIQPEQSRMFLKTSWVRAARAGLFLWYKCSGQKVLKGEPIGEINNPYGKGQIKVLAPRDGYIIGHNNAPVVSQGDALFHVGYERGS